jgi:hypothetical protein
MVAAALMAEVRALPDEDKRELIHALQQDVEATEPAVSDAELQLASERLAAYRANPTWVFSEDEVFAEIDALLA